MVFKGAQVVVLEGEHKGKTGTYLGTDGYTGSGVICRIQLETETKSYLWKYFRFTDDAIQKAWEADDELGELDF